VQLAVGDEVVIADPIEDVDLQPLAAIITDPAVQLVMHAPHADLVAFAQRLDAFPTNVFDTQIAAGFAGESAGLAYDRLVQDLLGVRLAASESFSDWSRRPLTDKQLEYAAADVEYLFDMADTITERLDSMGRVSWAREELERRFEDPARLLTQPGEAWRKVARRGRLSANDAVALRGAAAWREQTARTRDLPSSWVMKDATLIEIAKRKPDSPRQLSKIRGVDNSIRPDEQAKLIEMLDNPPESQDRNGSENRAMSTRSVRTRVSIAKGLATALLRARCEAAKIAPELVGTSSDVEELIAWVAAGRPEDASTPAMMSGWRAEFGKDLVALVDGDVQLQLIDKPPYLIVHGLD
jgi:ribonuclease D